MKKRIPRRSITRKAKQRAATKASSAIQSIPEIRRSFEIMEAFMNGLHSSTDSAAKKVAALQEKWLDVFGRELSTKMATDYIDAHKKNKSTTDHRTTRKKGGMAPVDAVMRPGIYATPGGMCSSYGDYLSKGFGFVTPSIAQGVPSTPALRVNGGGRKPRVHDRRRRSTQAGGMGLFETLGSYLSAATARPSESTQPASVVQDMRAMMNGQRVGLSPDPVQQPVPYRLR